METSDRSVVRPKLQRSVAVVKDLDEQGPSSHILIVGGGHVQQYYAVDSMTTSVSGTVAFFWKENPQGSKTLIYACRAAEGAWALVSREVSGVLSEKELITISKADQDAEVAFYKDLDPVGFKKAEEQMAEGGISLEDLIGAQRGNKKKTRTPEEEAALEERLNRQYL